MRSKHKIMKGRTANSGTKQSGDIRFDDCDCQHESDHRGDKQQDGCG